MESTEIYLHLIPPTLPILFLSMFGAPTGLMSLTSVPDYTNFMNYAIWLLLNPLIWIIYTGLVILLQFNSRCEKKLLCILKIYTILIFAWYIFGIILTCMNIPYIQATAMIFFFMCMNFVVMVLWVVTFIFLVKTSKTRIFC